MLKKTFKASRRVQPSIDAVSLFIAKKWSKSSEGVGRRSEIFTGVEFFYYHKALS
jgi:hypothetical protein